jgi:hypothetical protein
MNKTDLVFYFEKGITGLCNLIKGIFICLEEKKKLSQCEGNVDIHLSTRESIFPAKEVFFIWGEGEGIQIPMGI